MKYKYNAYEESSKKRADQQQKIEITLTGRNKNLKEPSKEQIVATTLRLTKSLLRDAKIYCATNDITLQELIRGMLVEKIKK